MRSRLLVLVLTLLTVTGAARAEAVTIRDIVELTRAGLSDDVLVALIEADGTIFSLDAPKILELREAGVSERVLVAMLRSGPAATRALAAQEQARQERATEKGPVVVILGAPSPPAVVEVPVPYPVLYPVPVVPPVTARRHVRHVVIPAPTTEPTRFGRFISDGTLPPGAYQQPAPRAKPVYWGWGGERRPDTWPHPRTERHRD
jgi:hypothetical protein